MDAEAAQELAAAADDSGRVLMVNFQRRFSFAVTRAKETMQRESCGTLQLNSQRIWWRNYDRIEITGTGEYLVLDDLWSIKHYTEDQNTFTENFILGEIIAQIAEETGEAPVARKLGLGSAAIAHAALLADEIDLYPEYSGSTRCPSPASMISKCRN